MSLLARHHLLLRRCTAAACSLRRPPTLLLLASPPPPPPLRARRSSSVVAMAAAAAAGGAAGDGAAKKAAAPEIDALALFTGPGADHLRVQSCSVHGCSADTPRVPDAELPPLLAALPAWRLSPDGSCLTRDLTARNFLAALSFFNAVGELAEEEKHHPDLHLTDYRRVRVAVATHEGQARVTMADLVLAAKIDALPVDYSPKWLRAQQKEMMSKGG